MDIMAGIDGDDDAMDLAYVYEQDDEEDVGI